MDCHYFWHVFQVNVNRRSTYVPLLSIQFYTQLWRGTRCTDGAVVPIEMILKPCEAVVRADRDGLKISAPVVAQVRASKLSYYRMDPRTKKSLICSGGVRR